MATRVLSLSALLLASCLDPMDRELTECHPNCRAVDAGGGLDAIAMDAADREDAGGQDVASMDASPQDAEEHPLEVLEAIEVTPHQITWRWNAERVPADVVAYRLRYAESMDGIASAEPWDASDDQNLAQRNVPDGPGIVQRTRVLELTPGTTYYARLNGLLEGGAEVPLAQGMGTTPVIPDLSLVLFDEELPLEAQLEGFRDPTLAEQAYLGVGALWFESGTVFGGAASNLGRAFPLGLGDRWSSAYLEMFVLVTPAQSIGFLEVMLAGFSEPPDPPYRYFALPPHAAWQRLEVPLHAFADVPGAEVFQSFGVRASSWGELRTVFVDAVMIRY